MVTRDRAAPSLALLVVVAVLAACDLVASLPDPAASNGAPLVTPVPTPILTLPAPTPEPTFLIYQVRPHDSLVGIAKRFKTTVDSIGYWNSTRYGSLDPDSPLYAPDAIEVGWLLRIHPGQTTDGDDSEPSESPAESGSPEASPADGPSAAPSG